MKTINTSMTHREIPWSGSITELSQLPGRVYVHLTTLEMETRFLQQTEAEGFTFPDGAKPTSREPAEIMAVNSDHTINYVGSNGRIAFRSARKVGEKKLTRITYWLL